jgi:hypothetical protein
MHAESQQHDRQSDRHPRLTLICPLFSPALSFMNRGLEQPSWLILSQLQPCSGCMRTDLRHSVVTASLRLINRLPARSKQLSLVTVSLSWISPESCPRTRRLAVGSIRDQHHTCIFECFLDGCDRVRLDRLATFESLHCGAANAGLLRQFLRGPVQQGSSCPALLDRQSNHLTLLASEGIRTPARSLILIASLEKVFRRPSGKMEAPQIGLTTTPVWKVKRLCFL